MFVRVQGMFVRVQGMNVRVQGMFARVRGMFVRVQRRFVLVQRMILLEQHALLRRRTLRRSAQPTLAHIRQFCISDLQQARGVSENQLPDIGDLPAILPGTAFAHTSGARRSALD
jgi:hypothetical protein